MGPGSWDIKMAGLIARDMTPEQQQKLLGLIRVYVQRAQERYAEMYMSSVVKPRLDELTFAWYGSTEQDKAHYYRIQGPELLIEYHDGQSTLDHVHSVWRDSNRDFGRNTQEQSAQAPESGGG